MREILTIPDLKRAIKRAPEVWMFPRFGTWESPVKVSKIEAMHIVKNAPDLDEMVTGTYGIIREDGIVVLTG